jgi:hypothetical protein
MNDKEKEERARKWISDINFHHELLGEPQPVDEKWMPVWVKVLKEAPEKVFAMPGFYEMAEMYAWKEIVDKNLGHDSKAALQHLQKLLKSVGAV